MRTPDQKPGVNKNQNRLERGDDLAVWFGLHVVSKAFPMEYG